MRFIQRVFDGKISPRGLSRWKKRPIIKKVEKPNKTNSQITCSKYILAILLAFRIVDFSFKVLKLGKYFSKFKVTLKKFNLKSQSYLFDMDITSFSYQQIFIPKYFFKIVYFFLAHPVSIGISLLPTSEFRNLTSKIQFCKGTTFEIKRSC